ncbi:adenylosuccinate synthase [Sphingobacterium yanglingense]|nr:adenylosuccinate synthase [Sphingobacterium yanglingense]
MAKMDILVGLQWGDEGKGKFIDKICPNYQIVARYNGGANAGHTIFWNGHKITLKLLPSGIFYSHITNVIGSGVVINPTQLNQEIAQLADIYPELNIQEHLLISQKAHLVLPTDQYSDIYMEGSDLFRTIGTTKNGIGHAYANKMLRQGFRVGDIFTSDFASNVEQVIRREYQYLTRLGQTLPDFQETLGIFLANIEALKELTITDTETFINKSLKEGKPVLAEGAQATMLDIDHGTYPYVTSSNTVASAACVGLGVSPRQVGEIFGVLKAYNTRVGEGPFPSEIIGKLGDELRIKGNEFGSNTKRPRRIGWLDLPALQYAIMLNGITQLIITKSDVLNGMDIVNVCTHYELDGKLEYNFPTVQDISQLTPHWKAFSGWNADFSKIKSAQELPYELAQYLRYLEAELEAPITHLSIGPERDAIINLK